MSSILLHSIGFNRYVPRFPATWEDGRGDARHEGSAAADYSVFFQWNGLWELGMVGLD